jgi:hypothetical protein
MNMSFFLSQPGKNIVSKKIEMALLQEMDNKWTGTIYPLKLPRMTQVPFWGRG